MLPAGATAAKALTVVPAPPPRPERLDVIAGVVQDARVRRHEPHDLAQLPAAGPRALNRTEKGKSEWSDKQQRQLREALVVGRQRRRPVVEVCIAMRAERLERDQNPT